MPSLAPHRSLAALALLLVGCPGGSPAEDPAAAREVPAAAGEVAGREVVGGASAGPTAAGSDWPRHRGPHGDGRSPETGLRLTWPGSGPPAAWDVEAGEGYAPPVVAAGRLYFFDREGDHERLRCLDAGSGAEIWRAQAPTTYEDMYGFGSGPRASPLVDGERVFTYGAEGRLSAYSVRDGALLWEVDTSRRFGVVQNFFGVGAAPLLEGELLIAQVGGSPPGSPSVRSGRLEASDSAVVAFDAATGAVRYAIGDDLASYATPVVAEIGGRRLGLVLARGGLLGFDAGSGEVAFSFPWQARKLESVNACTPLVRGNQVLIAEAYGPGSAVLDLAKGPPAILRSDPRRGASLLCHFSSPVRDGDTIYGVSGMGAGEVEVRAIDWASGEVHWSLPGLGRSALLWVDRHLVVLTERGTLLALQATPEAVVEVARGRPERQGRPLLGYPAWAAPILARGRLYARGADRLVAFDLRP